LAAVMSVWYLSALQVDYSIKPIGHDAADFGGRKIFSRTKFSNDFLGTHFHFNAPNFFDDLFLVVDRFVCCLACLYCL